MSAKGLVFHESSHRYRLDGRPVPGVTGLIGKGLPKPALVRWSAGAVAEWVAAHPDLSDQMAAAGGPGPFAAFLKQVPWSQRDKAAVRGTDVHTLAERLVHGDEVEVPEHLAAHVEGYVTWLDEFQPTPIWTERPVASRQWWYAGTFDLVAELMGQTWLLDVKTAKGVYGDNALQLAAYAGAEFLLDHDGAEVPIPQIDRLGVLHVTDAGTTLHPVHEDAAAAAWKDWLHVAWVAKAEQRIKDYFAAPIEAPTTSTGDAA